MVVIFCISHFCCYIVLKFAFWNTKTFLFCTFSQTVDIGFVVLKIILCGHCVAQLICVFQTGKSVRRCLASYLNNMETLCNVLWCRDICIIKYLCIFEYFCDWSRSSASFSHYFCGDSKNTYVFRSNKFALEKPALSVFWWLDELESERFFNISLTRP